MKLVVVFSTGDGYECSYDEKLCFEYDSPEKWLLDFEEKLKEALAEREKYLNWESQRVDVPSSPSRHQLKKWEEWRKKQPPYIADFEFCRQEFGLADFIDYDNIGKYFLPDVYTLDEWFQNELKQRQQRQERTK